MAEIIISESKTEIGWAFQVTLSNGNSTVHKVNLTKEYYEHLSLPDVEPHKVVESSFKFLLDREPKEMILRTFDLQIISKYFPEYEKRITEYI